MTSVQIRAGMLSNTMKSTLTTLMLAAMLVFGAASAHSAQFHQHYDITEPSGATAEQINSNLSGVMEGKGHVFVEAEEKYGVNAYFLVAIANLESGNGKSGAARNRNNVTGYKGGKTKFASVDECIMVTAEMLNRMYVQRGRKTPLSIGRRYCTNRSWPKKVASCMNRAKNP